MRRELQIPATALDNSATTAPSAPPLWSIKSPELTLILVLCAIGLLATLSIDNSFPDLAVTGQLLEQFP